MIMRTWAQKSPPPPPPPWLLWSRKPRSLHRSGHHQAAFDAQFTATTAPFKLPTFPLRHGCWFLLRLCSGPARAHRTSSHYSRVFEYRLQPLTEPSDSALHAPSTITMIQGGSSSTNLNTAPPGSGRGNGAPTLTVFDTRTGISTPITQRTW